LKTVIPHGEIQYLKESLTKDMIDILADKSIILFQY